MARFKDREKALALRKQGMSYSQIKSLLGISKSTLSVWLRNFPLSKERIIELRDRNERRIERFRETMRQKRVKRLEAVYNSVKDEISSLTAREFLMAGLGLYWGEGSKTKEAEAAVTNTDPSVLLFFINWITSFYNVSRSALRVSLHLYSDMDKDSEAKFWIEILGLPADQFTSIYIKDSSSIRINHKGSFGHGTCRVAVYNVHLKEKILMQLKTLSDYYSKKLTACSSPAEQLPYKQ